MRRERGKVGKGGGRKKERKKDVLAGFTIQISTHVSVTSLSIHVCITTQRKEFLAPTPVCVEIAEFNLNPDAFLQASGYEPSFLCKAR